MRGLKAFALVVALATGCVSAATTTAGSGDSPTTTTMDSSANTSIEPTPSRHWALRGLPDTEVAATALADATDAPAPTSTPTAAVVPTPTDAPASEGTALPTPLSDPTMTPTPAATQAPTVAAAATPTVVAEETPTPEATPTVVTEATPTPPPPTVDASETPTPSDNDDLPPTGYQGEVRAIRTSRGAVMAVRDIVDGNYQVVTPCYNVAEVTSGLALAGPLDVLIDPGHGGDEPGAVGPNGLVEADVNFAVAELLRAELIARGYTAELTRYDDIRVAIQSRAALANALAPRVFMSVHHNGGYPIDFPVAGTEVFVQLNDPESQRLGGLVFEEIQKAFADVDVDWMGNIDTFGVAWRQNDEGTDLYGVLRRTPDLVSVLTEAMFVSTPAEAELLAKPETLETEAQALADALERWFTTEDPGQGFIEGIVFQGDLGNGGGTEGCVDPPLN